MISKMNKLSFLVYHKDYDEFLERLRSLGVIHISTKQQGAPDEQLKTDMQQLQTAKSLLHEIEMSKEELPKSCAQNVSYQELVSEIESFNDRITQLRQQKSEVQKEISAFEVWGDFDGKIIDKLRENGWYLSFYTCPDKQFSDEFSREDYIIEVAKSRGRTYFITCSTQPLTLEAEIVHLPKTRLFDLQQRNIELDEAITEQQEALRLYKTSNYAILKKHSLRMQEGVELQKIRLSGEKFAENSVYLLEGWIPAENEKEVVDFLEQSHYYYEIRKATREDNAPIKLRNNAFTRMYEGITKMYGMPDYGEFDPTPIVAPFFTLFFAFCVGDAGYGIALILLGFYLKRKVKKDLAGMMNLIITLGIATMVLGAIFGTFFGANMLDWDLPENLKSLIVSGKVEVAGTEYDKPMVLALIIGVIHILVAMTVKAIVATVRYGFKSAVSDWSWLLLLVGFISVGGLSNLEAITPEMSKWGFIIIGGVAGLGIFILNDIHRNVFVNIGSGLWGTYNIVTGLLGDILSYIRLFALGLSGAMLGSVFNEMAFMIDIQIASIPMLGQVLTWVCCGLILTAGHTLNIAMSCLSAFVHPIRLTFVEYFKNVGYGGTGEAYKPFAKIENE